MEFSRRRLLGAFAVGGASLALPRSMGPQAAFAQDYGGLSRTIPGFGSEGLPRPLDLAETAAGQNRFASVLLPQAQAALDRHGHAIANRDLIGLVDFSAPSKAARFYLVDMPGGQVVSTHLVAHGRGSDPANSGWVEHLSNRPGSNASCEGAFLTGQTYYGQHGRSRRLAGLDPDNDQAEARGIVIHAADYVSPAMAANQGRVGRSQGCFAVSRAEIGDVLELLGPGHLLYAVK
ncbi:murein L,D-transpeptidase catalytic domain family protein [Novosphingobium bradum]|uniref:Murein L,D-transpeptidase catalytic domain family protein n=1 Tax=Novosphingobium bradum TaxID=1737444 RepID=A0ABV7IU13_9SPHN